MNDRSRNYTAADLYGSDGRPHATYIRQDDIFDCYFIARLGCSAKHRWR